jgi:hypothetical protein
VTEQFQPGDFQNIRILRSLTEETKQVQDRSTELLPDRFSFAQIIELIKNNSLKKTIG